MNRRSWFRTLFAASTAAMEALETPKLGLSTKQVRELWALKFQAILDIAQAELRDRLIADEILCGRPDGEVPRGVLNMDSRGTSD